MSKKNKQENYILSKKECELLEEVASTYVELGEEGASKSDKLFKVLDKIMQAKIPSKYSIDLKTSKQKEIVIEAIENLIEDSTHGSQKDYAQKVLDIAKRGE